MKETMCCFTGYSDLPAENRCDIRLQLEQEVKGLIDAGVHRFVCGGSPGFDTLAAFTVLKLQPIFPKVELVLVAPCKERQRRWKREDKERYAYLKSRAKRIIRTGCGGRLDCMCGKCRYLIKHSSVCVCYLPRESNGAARAVSYAQKRGLCIRRIASGTVSGAEDH